MSDEEERLELTANLSDALIDVTAAVGQVSSNTAILEIFNFEEKKDLADTLKSIKDKCDELLKLLGMES